MTAFRRWCLCIVAWLAMGSMALANIPGDSDGDGDVDFADAVQITDCQSGPDIPAIGLCQTPFDFDAEMDVDMADIAAFQRCFSGEYQPASPDCASHIVRIEDGCLHVIGTQADSSLTLRRHASLPSILEIDVGNDGMIDFAVNRDQFDCIVADARGGNDIVVLDESNGVFTDTELTTILGGSGNDTLSGGSGGEVFVGGDGNDTAVLGGGDDLFIWNPGDDTDSVDGGIGADTIEVNGGNGAEAFTVTSNGTFVRFDRLNPAPFHLDIGACEELVLNAGSGSDTLACTGNLAALIQITADGGAGDDSLLGSNGHDILMGGDDDDFVDGQQGNDYIFGGAGDDTIQWDPGDGSDTVEGQAGHDTINFNGSSAAETYDFAANPGSPERLRFTRNVANIVMDLNGVEQFDLRALGGADIVNVNDLTGLNLAGVNIELAGTLGGNSGDALADAVNIIGTPGADVFHLIGDAGHTIVELSTPVHVVGREALDQVVFTGAGGDTVNVNGSDGPDTMTLAANGTQARVDATGYSAAVAVSGALSLKINALGDNDMVSCVGNLAALVPITIDGGPGEDTLLGSNGPDVIIGGDDNDFIDGQQGSDTLYGGNGDDTIQWDPGDGNDQVEGQVGYDTLVFNGSNAAEIFDIAANPDAPGRLRFTRNVASIIMDIDDIEQFHLQALGGADVATINDLTGTDVVQVSIRLAGTLGGNGGDAQADSVIVNGTNDADDMVVAGGITGALVTGLSAVIGISTAEATFDRLTINALGSDDTVQAAGLPSGVIGLTLNGGTGNDQLVGGYGADVLNGDDDDDTIVGGDGSDTVSMGSGDDLFIWNPGDNTDLIDGDLGSDTVQIDGADGAEEFTVSDNGTRVRFERLNPDPSILDIGTCENLVLHANGGSDALVCTGNLAALIHITADGGPGQDFLQGSNGPDVLIGGDDNDYISGQQGNDSIFMGAGDDVFLREFGDGNDTVEGQDGHDTINFNGSSAGEVYDFLANPDVPGRLRFARNIIHIVMDADDVEQFNLRVLGGADVVRVNDLTGLDLAEVNIELAATLAQDSADMQADAISIHGTDVADAIHVSASAGEIEVAGLACFVRIMRSEPTLDTLALFGHGGVDTITGDPGVSTLIQLTVFP